MGMFMPWGFDPYSRRPKPAFDEPEHDASYIDRWLARERSPKGPTESSAYVVGGKAYDKNAAPPQQQPVMAPVGEGMQQGAMAAGGAMRGAGGAVRGLAGTMKDAAGGTYIRLAQAMKSAQDKAEEQADIEALAKDFPKPEPEMPSTGYMSDARADYLKRDYLRRMAIRHQDQLAKHGLTYDNLEAEYDNAASGSHAGKVKSMAGLMSRLRAAHDVEVAKRVTDMRQQDAMAKRLGVPLAGVIFNHELGNARTPEDRIRAVLSYHAMFPNLGLGNMAAMMEQQAAEGRGVEAQARLQAEQTQAARDERAADRESGERMGMAGLQAGLQQAGLGHAADYNRTLLQGQMTMNQLAQQQQGAMALQGVMGDQQARQAMLQQQLAQSQTPSGQATAALNAIAGAPVGQAVPLATQHDAILHSQMPARDPKTQANDIVQTLDSHAQQVFRAAAAGRLTPEQLMFASQYLHYFMQAHGDITGRPGFERFKQRFGLDEQTAAQVVYSLMNKQPASSGAWFTGAPPPGYSFSHQ